MAPTPEGHLHNVIGNLSPSIIYPEIICISRCRPCLVILIYCPVVVSRDEGCHYFQRFSRFISHTAIVEDLLLRSSCLCQTKPLDMVAVPVPYLCRDVGHRVGFSCRILRHMQLIPDIRKELLYMRWSGHACIPVFVYDNGTGIVMSTPYTVIVVDIFSFTSSVTISQLERGWFSCICCRGCGVYQDDVLPDLSVLAVYVPFPPVFRFARQRLYCFFRLKVCVRVVFSRSYNGVAGNCVCIAGVGHRLYGLFLHMYVIFAITGICVPVFPALMLCP